MTNPLLDHLLSRASPPIHEMSGPGPDDQQIATMIRAASRVPDHGRLSPWRFILYRGGARDEVGKQLAELAERREGPLSDVRRGQEMTRFSRAPLVIGVVSSPRPHPKIPQWEMFLSAGAAAMNLVHAAHALGYKANWITNWYSDDAEGRAILGLQPHERVAGFVHIGRPDVAVVDRPRSEPEALVSDWLHPSR